MSISSACRSAPPPLVEQLLAEAPRVRDAARQAALTARFLTPARPALEALFLALRSEADGALRAARPGEAGRPYPLGQCLAITKAVEHRLAGGLEAGAVGGAAAEGAAALAAFTAAGGAVRRAWGDLRGEVFQNALLVGTLYVDVANDTVVTTKPKVEVRPLAEAAFTPIADHAHYARIAARYWGWRLLPNHVLPQLAPYLPLIQVTPDGRVSLGSTGRYMLGLTLASGFASGAGVLAGPALPPVLFARLAAALGDASNAGAEAGRAGALAAVATYRAEGRADRPEALAQALGAGAAANRQLQAIRIGPADLAA